MRCAGTEAIGPSVKADAESQETEMLTPMEALEAAIWRLMTHDRYRRRQCPGVGQALAEMPDYIREGVKGLRSSDMENLRVDGLLPIPPSGCII